jgi:hypothetical protein
MMWITIVVVVVFAIIGAGCVLLSLVGLPGTWVMLGLAVLIELGDSLWSGGQTWGWWTLGICGGLAVLGEVLETAAGALGVKVGGGSRRGMVGAIIGGIAGGLLLTPVIPIPVIGTLIGAVIGTFVGAVVGELTHPIPQQASGVVVSATGATIGRILGILGKSGIAATCWIILVVVPFL